MRVEADALMTKVYQARGKGQEYTEIADPRLYSIAEGEALTHLIAAKMWLGKMLEGLGSAFPKELADKAN